MNFLKYIPKLYQKDFKAIALSNKFNNHFGLWKNDIMNLLRLIRPDEMPAIFLDELGYMLNANLLNLDTERVKRQKIQNAIQQQKLRGSWKYDAKLRIDRIVGYNSKLHEVLETSEWIQYGGNESSDLVVKYWGTIGTDGIDMNTGLDLWISGQELQLAGNIPIDCHYGIHISTLTASQISDIVLEIENDVVPAYMRVFLGYVDVSGNFITYTNGIIH